MHNYLTKKEAKIEGDRLLSSMKTKGWRLYVYKQETVEGIDRGWWTRIEKNGIVIELATSLFIDSDKGWRKTLYSINLKKPLSKYHDGSGWYCNRLMENPNKLLKMQVATLRRYLKRVKRTTYLAELSL